MTKDEVLASLDKEIEATKKDIAIDRKVGMSAASLEGHYRYKQGLEYAASLIKRMEDNP